MDTFKDMVGEALNEASVLNKDDAHELELFMDNDGEIYRQKDAFWKNVGRKLKNGKYDHSKAPKLWINLVDRADKKYNKDFGSGTGALFGKKTREFVATRLASSELLLLIDVELNAFNPSDVHADIDINKLRKDANSILSKHSF